MTPYVAPLVSELFEVKIVSFLPVYALAPPSVVPGIEYILSKYL